MSLDVSECAKVRFLSQARTEHFFCAKLLSSRSAMKETTFPPPVYDTQNCDCTPEPHRVILECHRRDILNKCAFTDCDILPFFGPNPSLLTFHNVNYNPEPQTQKGATELGPGRLRPAFVTELGPTELGPEGGPVEVRRRAVLRRAVQHTPHTHTTTHTA